MKVSIVLLFIQLSIVVLITGCGSGAGPDSISSGVEIQPSESIMSDCTKCHTSSKSPSLDPLVTNGDETSGKHDIHVKTMGIGCEKCHYGYQDSATHMDGSFETGDSSVVIVNFDNTNPSGTWIDDTGKGTGSCASLDCHGGKTLSWYTTETWTLPSDCSTCHASSIGNRRQVVGAGGDFSKESHHVIDYSNRANEIITSNDCKVCHNMEKHMSGQIRLNDEDNDGNVIVYDPSNPSSLEPFCLSCHDADGATIEGADALSPFSDSNTLGVIPNEAGNKIAGYWNSTNNVHRTNGLTCAGTGEPGSGCHGDNGTINMHGSSNYGLLSGYMNFQIEANASYNENDYKLCFSCHANYSGITKEDILGVKKGGNYDYELIITPAFGGELVFGTPPYYTEGIATKFVDSDAYIHDSGTSKKYQLHWFHLSMRIHGNNDVWLYRGQGNSSGCTGCHSNPAPAGKKATCTACHNVHGSNFLDMVYDELKITHDTGETTGFMGTARENIVNSPMYCGLSECHSSTIDNNNYIFNPTGE